MIKSLVPVCTITAVLALSACSTAGTAPVAQTAGPLRESITYSVGPCFGFCPVYSVAISAEGNVSFDGKRHTAALGTRSRDAGRGAYSNVAAALAPFRPASGTSAKTTCDVEASDGSTYQVVWTTPDGRKTGLDHNLGCRSDSNDRLNAVLRQVPDMLGIDAWSHQTTREGASRG